MPSSNRSASGFQESLTKLGGEQAGLAQAMSQLALQPLPDVHSPSKTGPGRNPQGLVQSRDAAAPAAAPAQAEAADVPVAAAHGGGGGAGGSIGHVHGVNHNPAGLPPPGAAPQPPVEPPLDANRPQRAPHAYPPAHNNMAARCGPPLLVQGPPLPVLRSDQLVTPAMAPPRAPARHRLSPQASIAEEGSDDDDL